MSWTIDHAHSHIQFSARHMMITNVRGEFEKFTGQIEFDENNLVNSKATIEIDAASINTREDKRDAHLRSADFFDAEKYPTIRFVSKHVAQTDAHHGRLIGDLTIRDVTKEVTLDVDYTGALKNPWGNTSAGFSAEGKINRKDWGLNWNVALEAGGVLVGDEIKLTIELELVKVAETVPAAAATA
ncbi:MAG TPA: YceI family protein [Aggregatilineales bacterium]|nr:YceI family protein [Aggregatilineales bacterium]